MTSCVPFCSRFARPVSSVLILLAAFVALLAMAPAARAASCSETLVDSLGYRWDVTSGTLDLPFPSGTSAGGFVDQGGLNSLPAGPFGSEAYDGWGVLKLDVASTPAAAEYYIPSDLNGCDREDAGREITLPTKTIDGLEVSRKVYVPASGTGFIRFLDFVRNPNLIPAVGVQVSYEGDLGSDSETRVRDTSSGDPTVLAPPDRWATSDADPAIPDPITGAPHTDPPVAHVWDGPGTPPAPTNGVFGGTSGSTAWGDGQAHVRVDYQSLTIPANTTYVFMHFEAQRTTTAAALGAAQALGNVTVGDGFGGISETELASLRNWNPSDLDGDLVSSPADNCRFVSNSGQANLDGDSFGDACDEDIDGDGLSNADEARLGTNPAAADSDGDGRLDGADACPLTPASTADGCPLAPSPPAAALDKTPPKVTVIVQRKAKRKGLGRGLSAAARINEPASAKFELLAPARPTRRTRTRARAFTRKLATQSLGTAGAGLRAVRLRPAKKLLGRSGKLVIQLRVTAVDRAGNRTVATKTVTVT